MTKTYTYIVYQKNRFSSCVISFMILCTESRLSACTDRKMVKIQNKVLLENNIFYTIFRIFIITSNQARS